MLQTSEVLETSEVLCLDHRIADQVGTMLDGLRGPITVVLLPQSEKSGC